VIREYLVLGVYSCPTYNNEFANNAFGHSVVSNVQIFLVLRFPNNKLDRDSFLEGDCHTNEHTSANQRLRLRIYKSVVVEVRGMQHLVIGMFAAIAVHVTVTHEHNYTS
jgi:hypothetical protein